MKDAVLTIRVPSSLRRRIEGLARKEGRSLSQQVGRLIEQGIAGKAEPAAAPRRRELRLLSGIFPGGQVPTLNDFRKVRALISRSLAAGNRTLAQTRR